MKITKKDNGLFNNTNANDICMGNDNYNIAKGYCSYKVYRILKSIRDSHYGVFNKAGRLTVNIVKNYPEKVSIASREKQGV